MKFRNLALTAHSAALMLTTSQILHCYLDAGR